MAAPTITQTTLHITSKSRALAVAREPLTGGQLRLATDTLAWGGSFQRALTGLVRDVCDEAPLQAVVVALPPTANFSAYRVYTGEIVGTRLLNEVHRVLVFVDGTVVDVDDVLAVTI